MTVNDRRKEDEENIVYHHICYDAHAFALRLFSRHTERNNYTLALTGEAAATLTLSAAERDVEVSSPALKAQED